MLNFETFTDEKECKELWEKFSPKLILWDLWNFRSCFHNSNFSFNFICGFEGKNKVGLLPLVFDEEYKTHIYFGDTFPERNKFYLKDKKNIKLFLENCPDDTQIYYIDAEDAKYYDFKKGDRRYFLNLNKYGNSFENYVGSFKKKHRKNLNYDLKKLKELKYTVERNKLKHVELLAEMNKKQFGRESDFNDKDFVSSIAKLADRADKMHILDLLTIKVNNKAEAAGLGVFYNQIYSVLCVGRNPEIKNLGKLLISEHIKSAISCNCKEIEFMSTKSNWKELWNLDSEQMYEFEN